ncbi:hypothetical protein Leryth_014309 [Lithospermum erythrorhizon]|nr:hypothetical protein Leryth_014309 [Lithospermum erythrorhizon]
MMREEKNETGSSSTDAGSHSNNSQGGQRQLSTTATSTTSERSDLNGPSSLLQSDQANEKAANLLRTMSSPKIPTPECSNPKKCEPINKPMLTLKEQTSSTSSQCKEAVIKPSMPQSNNCPLPRMPFVSTTGNGPNGKTVNGFLYNYSKTEVNIVCVCHGCSFSPAKFVEHAGGIDISHPLKHITIVPTPFG